MEFKTYLVEGKRDTVVFSHGRMNPVTVGHQKMVEAGQKVANNLNADYELSITHSHDPKKNPLSVEQKLKHVKRAFPKVKVTTTSKDSPSFLHKAKELFLKGYKHLVMVAGSDRAQEYHDTLHKYNGHPDFFDFKSIRVPNAKEMHHIAGVHLERDPDSEGAEGMSASKMRTHAANNDFGEFRKGVPAHFTDAQAREMFNDVRQGQVRKENRDIRQKYINGEIYNIGDRVISEAGIGDIVFRGATYVTIQLEDQTTEKYWIADLEEQADSYFTKTGKLKQNPRNPSGLSKKYSGDLSHSTQVARRQHFKQHAQMSSKDPTAYKPAPGDKGSETRMSKYTKRYHDRFKIKESGIPALLLTKEQKLLVKEASSQITYNGYTTSNLDLCPGAQKTLGKLITMTDKNPEFILKAIQATDAMLGVERLAMQRGFADEEMTHDFTTYMVVAHDSLNMLGFTDEEIDWLKTHLKIMSDYGMRPEENWAAVYGLVPSKDSPGEVEESMNYSTHKIQKILIHNPNGKTSTKQHLVKKIDFKDEISEAADSALAKKASASGVSIGTLRQVYKRGVAAWRTGHRPGTTPQQWGMARVNSYITKGKTYHTADKDLREQEENQMQPDVKQMATFKHMDSPAENPQRDLNFTNDKDVFHGLDQTIDDQGYEGKPVGMVSFKSFMHEPEFVKSAAEHDKDRASIHAAQVTDFAKHGISYKSMAKRSQLEP